VVVVVVEVVVVEMEVVQGEGGGERVVEAGVVMKLGLGD